MAGLLHCGVADPKIDRRVRLLTPEQHNHAEQLYLGARLMPAVIVIELKQKFGVLVTVKQMQDYIKTRGWSKKRKKMAEFMTPTESEAIAAVADIKSKAIVQTAATNAMSLVDLHQEAITTSARGAMKGLKKAEQFVDRAVDAKTLVSAMSALKMSTDVYRKAVGLDLDPGAVIRSNVFNIYFAKEAGSPFAVPAQPVHEIETVEEATASAGEESAERAEEPELSS